MLDGAVALAVPTRLGQSLSVKQEHSGRQGLSWASFTSAGERWFSGHFDLPSGKYLEGSDEAVGLRLEQIFRAAKALQPGLWENSDQMAYSVRTDLEFPRQWGLGTSSTLIANLAAWWKVDPYQLLAATFGGSGYDLACATAVGALFYQLDTSGTPRVRPADFAPPFVSHLYFLYLEQKQNSRAEIARYRERGKLTGDQIERISVLSRQITEVQTLDAFCELMEEHERLVGNLIGIIPVKERLFPDFSGTVKSLGAWGGDFVLVASNAAITDLKAYFSTRGFSTLIPFEEIVLQDK